MNPIVSFIAVFSLAGQIFAQGTIQFGALLDGTHAIPPSGSSLQVNRCDFKLEGSQFQGHVFLEDPYPFAVTSMALFRANSVTEFGTSIAPFVPTGRVDGENGVGSGTQFSVDLVLSPNQIDDLLGGFFFVNVGTQAFPNGEVRGQIVMIPEPAVLSLFAVGFCLAVNIRRCLIVQSGKRQEVTH
jgi:hypothetical protein